MPRLIIVYQITNYQVWKIESKRKTQAERSYNKSGAFLKGSVSRAGTNINLA